MVKLMVMIMVVMMVVMMMPSENNTDDDGDELTLCALLKHLAILVSATNIFFGATLSL